MSDVRIYAACLAAYNSGRLHGVWIDCDGKDADEIQEAISAMLEASPEPDAEEWAIHDFECPDQLRSAFGECMGLERVQVMAELAEMIGRGDHYAAGIGLALEVMAPGHDAADVESWIDDAYLGESRYGPAGWAEESLEDQGMFQDVPEQLRTYFDFEAYARDCGFDGINFVDPQGRHMEPGENGTCYAFSSR